MNAAKILATGQTSAIKNHPSEAILRKRAALAGPVELANGTV